MPLTVIKKTAVALEICQLQKQINELQSKQNALKAELLAAISVGESVRCNLGYILKEKGKQTFKYHPVGQQQFDKFKIKMLAENLAYNNVGDPYVSTHLI